MIIRRWSGDMDFDMTLDWFDWQVRYHQCPIVKVDGQVIKNVTMADDVLGFVKHLKANKIVTVTGNVEIIGQRI